MLEKGQQRLFGARAEFKNAPGATLQEGMCTQGLCSTGIQAVLRGLGIKGSAGEQFNRALIGQRGNIPWRCRGAGQGGWCWRNVWMPLPSSVAKIG